MRSLSELFKASVLPQTDVLTLENIGNIAYYLEKQGIIQIGIINMDYSIIDSSAINSENPKLEVINQRFSRIENKNPYIDKKALVISPIAKEIIQGENIIFEFGKIFIQKTNNPIKDLVAVFENNQTFTILQNSNFVNESINVNFQESGLKEIAFDITFEDSTNMTTYANCIVLTNSSESDPSIIGFTASKSFQSVHEGENCDCDIPNACFGKGEYKVYCAPSNNTGKIQKPIIITDGFDPGDARRIDALSLPWYWYVGEQPFDMVGGFNGALMPYKPETIYNMMYQYGSTETSDPNFIDDLHALGFDVILLNFPKYAVKHETITYDIPFPPYEYSITVPTKWRTGSSDYFERSAKVVRTMIEIVNVKLTQAQSNEKIILIGPSGGALLCRIALVEMEQDGVDHNVKLYVSFDGPHLGANVPIGMQKGAQYLGLDYIDALGLNPLNNPWSKQSVLHHYMANSQYPAGVPGYREEFQTMVDNLGFPQECRNIAFNNGSTNIPNALAGENMFYVYFKYDFWGIFPKKHEMWVDFTNNSGIKNVFKYKYKIKDVWGNWETITNDVLTSSTYSNYGSLDTCPGSYLDIIDRTFKNSHATFPLYYFDGATNYPFEDFDWAPIVFSWFTNNYVWADLKKDAIFMPSKSTLAYSGDNPSWYENLGCRDLVCTGETPFDTYYTPVENQAHVSVHYGEGINWLLNEIQGIEMLPKYNCPPSITSEILGDNTICYNDINTYNLTDSCNVNATWSVSNNLQEISSNNEIITVKSINTNTGLAWIKATYDNGESTIRYIVGKPYYTTLIKNSNYPKITIHELTVPLENIDITSIEWEQTGGDGTLVAENNSFTAYATGSGDAWSVNGNVKVTNNCGSTEKNFYLQPSDGGLVELEIFSLGQNKYRVIDPSIPEATQNVDASELYNLYGIKIQDLLPENNEIDINDTGAPGSIRIITAVVDGKTVTKRIITD